MARPKRIRRTLALRVSEARRGDAVDPNSPGQRFATGWQFFSTHGYALAALPLTDPIEIAGFLAAKTAWDAHHYAVNLMQVEPTLDGRAQA